MRHHARLPKLGSTRDLTRVFWQDLPVDVDATAAIKRYVRRAHRKSIIEYRNRMSAWDRSRGIRPEVRGTDETLDRLIGQPVSFSRFGDGEFQLVFGASIYYQERSLPLQAELKRILRSTRDDCLIGIPDVFGNNDRMRPMARDYWEGELRPFRHNYHRALDLKKTYYDSFASRIYKDLEDKAPARRRFEQWQRVWEGKDLVIIEGALSRLGVGNDLFSNARRVRRILGPAENAYSQYNELLAAALACESSALFILALGPTATVLSYALCENGRRALDLGHIDIEYEWFLRQEADVAIRGKYTNEALGGRVVGECEHPDYDAQIIADLSGRDL